MTGESNHVLISVLMPSYNHGKFIVSAIKSVLAQTVKDIELIIVDDGSRDDSPRILSGMQDARVRVRLLERNVGACHAMNTALQMSAGRFIAVCNSDDLWMPDKLSRQLKAFDQSPSVSAIFSDVDWIGPDGKRLERPAMPPFANVFRQKNRSRWTWLRNLLESGNCLCHPSILIRREAYDEVGLYDNRLRQLPDLEMWTRIVQKFDIFVMADRLVRFRIHDRNTSAPAPDVSRRDLNERRFILRKVMDGISSENFMKTFGSKGVCISDALDLQIEKALYLISSKTRYTAMFRELGLDLLFDVLANPEGQTRLEEKFRFSVLDFQREMGLHTPWTDIPVSSGPAGDALAGLRSSDLVKTIAARARIRAGVAVRRALRRA